MRCRDPWERCLAGSASLIRPGSKRDATRKQCAPGRKLQSAADVSATRASLQAARTDAVAAEAALNTALADLNRAKSDYEREQLDWNRAKGLYKEALIAKSEYDSRHAAWQTADAGLAQAQARVAQAKAQKDSAERHIAQMSANLTHASDVLQKTTYAAPFDGMITNLPVREGETGVIGIQDPPEDLRPGLSATAKITTATRSQALTIPIQALTSGRQTDLESKTENSAVQAAGPQNAASKQKDKDKDKDKEEIQGVFVIRNG